MGNNQSGNNGINNSRNTVDLSDGLTYDQQGLTDLTTNYYYYNRSFSSDEEETGCSLPKDTGVLVPKFPLASVRPMLIKYVIANVNPKAVEVLIRSPSSADMSIPMVRSGHEFYTVFNKPINSQCEYNYDFLVDGKSKVTIDKTDDTPTDLNKAYEEILPPMQLPKDADMVKFTTHTFVTNNEPPIIPHLMNQSELYLSQVPSNIIDKHVYTRSKDDKTIFTIPFRLNQKCFLINYI